MLHDSRDISPRFSNITARRKSRPPSYNTATRGIYARSARLRFEERATPSRQVAYKPPHVQTVSDSSSGTIREIHRTRAPYEETFQPTMEEDDRMCITPSELNTMDARALASISRSSYPHAPCLRRSRTTPTIGSNSYLSSTYMNGSGTRTVSFLDSASECYTAAPQSSASRYQARHRQPSSNYHSTFPRLLPTQVRSPRTFSHTLDPVLRDDTLFSLSGIDSLEDEDPYLRDSAGEVYNASAPGTYEEVNPFQLAAAHPQPYSAEYNTAPHKRSSGFFYDHGREYNDYTRWDPSKQSEAEQRVAEGTYRWSNPTHDKLPDIEDETFKWSSSSHGQLADEQYLGRHKIQQRRRSDSPLRRRCGNERLSTMFEEDGMDRRGETEIEVKTAGGTVVKVRKAGRREERGYR